MLNHILKNSFLKKRLKILEKKKKLYQNSRSIDEIYLYQIEHFNKVWRKAFTQVPFYKYWKKKYDLPESIKSLDELRYFPVLEKKSIQKNQKLIFSSIKDFQTISTGGSTGEPTNFPISSKESENSYANHYLARGWWNVKPLDRIFLIWGHSHLFGDGIKGQINYYKRLFYDWLINTKRLSAYDLSINSLSNYYQILKKSNPTLIIGYTSAIYKLAKHIDENNLDIENKSNLKGVVVTSETVTNYDINLIKKVFNVPCIIEYGMAETGIIAHSKKDSENIHLFWDTFIGIKDKDKILNLTTINERVFPLINYKTDDLISSNDNLSILQIEKILGRKNDFIKVKIGNSFVESHSEFFTHILKSINGIFNFKIIQKKNMDIEIKYVSQINLDISENFFNEISKEFKGFDKNTFTFTKVEEIPKTIAGKEKWIEVQK